MTDRIQIEWRDLRAIEPLPDEIARHAGALAAAYNEPRNSALLGHIEPMSQTDVVEHYASLDAQGARPFVLVRDELLAGDGDLRGITNRVAEFAFLIASPDAQGKGLGTRFAIMVHAFAFTRLELDRVYASVVPGNVASRRVFDKLGYALDDGEVARGFADLGDVVLSIDRDTFERRHAAALGEIVIASR